MRLPLSRDTTAKGAGDRLSGWARGRSFERGDDRPAEILVRRGGRSLDILAHER